jgi:hypothetical protein
MKDLHQDRRKRSLTYVRSPTGARGLEFKKELLQDHTGRSLTWMQLHIGADHFSIDDLLVLDLPEGEGHGEEALPQVGDREVHNENVPEERF